MAAILLQIFSEQAAKRSINQTIVVCSNGFSRSTAEAAIPSGLLKAKAAVTTNLLSRTSFTKNILVAILPTRSFAVPDLDEFY
jgi:hypothetical protein